MRHVMNFTDVDDKTIAAAQQAGVSLREYTDRFVAAFHEDAAAMGLEPVEEKPRATDEANLRAMVDMILSLEARGHTYRSDGSIYFRIATLPEYGKLARLDHEGIQAGARVDADTLHEAGRARLRPVESHQARRADLGLRLRAGPAGLAHRVLGDGAAAARRAADRHSWRRRSISIFPHHENEIAQAEGATGRPFVRFWVHVEFLNFDNEKMSKSLGNVFTVRDILDKGYRASSLRYLLISVHYRKQLTFNWDVLAQADAAVTRLADFLVARGRRPRRRRRTRASTERVARGPRRVSRDDRGRSQRARRAGRDVRAACAR